MRGGVHGRVFGRYGEWVVSVMMDGCVVAWIDAWTDVGQRELLCR